MSTITEAATFTLDWISVNKTWFFSGIGIAIPLAVIGWLVSTKPNKHVQKSGKNSTNIAVGGNATITSVKNYTSAELQEQSHDQHLFQEFQSALSYEPAIRLLREHDFGGSFNKKDIQPLFDFVETWNQPEKEFIDENLQAALTELYRAARSMVMCLAEKTSPIGNEDFSVFSNTLRNAGPRPDWVIEDARVLNEQANLFFPVYEDFLRLCRKKLKK